MLGAWARCAEGGTVLLDELHPLRCPCLDTASSRPCVCPHLSPRTIFSKCKSNQHPTPPHPTQPSSGGFPGSLRLQGQRPESPLGPSCPTVLPPGPGPPVSVWSVTSAGSSPTHASQCHTPAPPAPSQQPSALWPLENSLCPHPALSDGAATSQPTWLLRTHTQSSVKHTWNFKVFFLFLKFYLSLAVSGLRCCTQAFSTCGERGLLFVAVRGLLIVVASLVVEHGL